MQPSAISFLFLEDFLKTSVFAQLVGMTLAVAKYCNLKMAGLLAGTGRRCFMQNCNSQCLISSYKGPAHHTLKTVYF